MGSQTSLVISLVQPFSETLAKRLEAIREQDLYRSLRRIDSAQSPELKQDQRPLIAFASNDYLGLANHPKLKAAARNAVETFGAGSGASRLITGSLPPHRQLETALARMKDTEAALTFGTGYQAALGALTSLIGKNDVIVSDQLNHACLIDGARLTKAPIRVFRHNDLQDLETVLQDIHRDRKSGTLPDGATLIVTEAVFSMDGDQAPLAEIVALKEQYQAWLMIDEAHATGLFGPHGSGLAAAHGLTDAIEIQMGTLGKAVGAAGGFLCGSQLLVDFLINSARSFIFSTAPAPAAAAAASAGLEVLQSAEGDTRRKQVWEHAQTLVTGLHLPAPALSPIIPFPVGRADRSLRLAQQLEAAGFLVPAIRYPSVPQDQARLRITVTADHRPEAVQSLIETLHRLEPKLIAAQ